MTLEQIFNSEQAKGRKLAGQPHVFSTWLAVLDYDKANTVRGAIEHEAPQNVKAYRITRLSREPTIIDEFEVQLEVQYYH